MQYIAHPIFCAETPLRTPALPMAMGINPHKVAWSNNYFRVHDNLEGFHFLDLMNACICPLY